MNNTSSNIIKQLDAYKVCNIQVDSDQKIVNAEFWDEKKKQHQVEFKMDSYLFLDKESVQSKDINQINVRQLSPGSIEIIGKKIFRDGSISEETVASPNIMLRSDKANLFLQSNSFTMDGKNYYLTPRSSRSNYEFFS